MKKVSNGTILTDLNDTVTSDFLTERDYTVRHLEICQYGDCSCITWDAPDLTEADLDDTATSEFLTERGYTIRHLGSYRYSEWAYITWDAPDLTEADLPY